MFTRWCEGFAIGIAIMLTGCAARGDVAPGGKGPSQVSVDEVIARVAEALGGKASLDALRNLRVRAEWTEGGTHFAGDYRATRDGLMRIDVFVDGRRVFSEGIDSSGAWEQKGEGEAVTTAPDKARQALEHGVTYRFHGIWTARERGNAVTLEGRERADGIDYYVLKLRFQDGFETYFFVNPSTWLPERQRDVRAYHPSNDPGKTVIETVHEEYGTQCGVKVPVFSRDTDLRKNQVLAAPKVISSRCNVPVAELEIDRPR